MTPHDRDRLIAELARTITDQRVLAAIAGVARERFVAPELRDQAYANVALPIGYDQTISQPLVVARMTELLALSPTDRVLDVGTGSGYHAAVLARLAAHVWTIERCPPLSVQAQDALAALGVTNVTCCIGDGTRGLVREAPFDAINVAAGTASVPAALEAQLAVGGRLVVPVGEADQHLMVVRRSERGLTRERHEPVRFVPLIGDEMA